MSKKDTTPGNRPRVLIDWDEYGRHTICADEGDDVFITSPRSRGGALSLHPRRYPGRLARRAHWLSRRRFIFRAARPGTRAGGGGGPAFAGLQACPATLNVKSARMRSGSSREQQHHWRETLIAARVLSPRMNLPNPLAPECMSAAERLAEVTRTARPRPHPAPRPTVKSISAGDWRKFAGLPAHQSGHAKPSHDGEPHDRPDPRPRGRAEDDADAGAEAAVARALRAPSRRPTTAASSKAGSPTGSRNWPTAG